MFVKDPCGITCILVTYLAVFYADYVIVRWVILQTMVDSLWGALNVLIFNTLILLLGMAHARAVLTDPGTVPLPHRGLDYSLSSPAAGAATDHDVITGGGCDFVDWTICTRCETYRPPRAHHCRICQRCIRRMDHHCPWINNCVGERNQKYFIQFLIYVGALSAYAITLIVVSWIIECHECNQDMLIKQARIMHCVILLLESALFGMFVSAILVDQVQAILTDETAIEQLQHQGYNNNRPYNNNNKRKSMVLLGEVCGREHPIWWLIPCASTSTSGSMRRYTTADLSSSGTVDYYHV